MRTKALLLAAAFAVTTCATSMAQVYSANAVGYVNITVDHNVVASPANPFGTGYAIIANPLNGTNNLLSTILPLPASVAAGDVSLYKFDPNTGLYAQSFYIGNGNWFPDATLNPGEGAFMALNESVVPLNITFVGEVPQGTGLTVDLVGNAYNLVGSIVPQALPLGGPGIAGTLEFPGVSGDLLYIFDSSTQLYQTVFPLGGGAWFPVGPTGQGPVIPVASGFFVFPTGDLAWTRDFSVN